MSALEPLLNFTRESRVHLGPGLEPCLRKKQRHHVLKLGKRVLA